MTFYGERYPDRDIEQPNPKIMDELVNFSWPGNIRQLQNIIKKQIVVNDWKVILEELKAVANEISYSYNANDTKPDNRDSSPSKTQNEPEILKGIYKRRRAGDIPKNSILSQLIDIEGDFQNNISEFSLKNIKKKAVSNVEREIIGYVLNKTGWNRSKTSRILKVSYKTLLTKIFELNIEPPSR